MDLRRPLIPAPAEGPAAIDHMLIPESGHRPIGGNTLVVTYVPDWVIPVRVMPEPHPLSHLLIPQMYQHHYGPPFIPESVNRGKLDFPSPTAETVPMAQRAYRLRTNYRRPTLVKPGDLEP